MLMRSRPLDASGDILPACSPSSLLSGSEALAAALRDYLRLFRGDWWEYASRGSEALDLLTLSRPSGDAASILSGYLSSYLLAFPGVDRLSDVSATLSSRGLTFSCLAHAADRAEASVSLAL